ncbi:MAG: DUF2064 domain-containing protein, partial [Ruegeria sp.]
VELVFGPAFDGGYWLVGAQRYRQLPTGMFKCVRWSTQHALTDTLNSARGCRVGLIDQLRDVDTVADLQAASPS